MYNYIDIKRSEDEVNSRIEIIQNQRKQLLEPLYKLKSVHPTIFRVLPDENINSKKIESRLEVLEEDINLSMLSEKEKSNNINQIQELKKHINKLNDQEAAYESYLNETVYVNKEKRRKYLQEKLEKGQDLKEQLDKIKNRIKELKEKKIEFQQENIEHNIIKAIDTQILLYESKCEEIRQELMRILDEPGIEEEFELLIKENKVDNMSQTKKEEFDRMIKEVFGNQEKAEIPITETEDDKKENSEKKEENKEEKTEDNKKENSEKKEENKEAKAEDNKKENPDKKEENKEELEKKLKPLKKEKAKKVKSKHEASSLLKNKIKKFGAVSLGVITITTAMALFLANPLITLGSLTAGYVLSENKGIFKKK